MHLVSSFTAPPYAWYTARSIPRPSAIRFGFQSRMEIVESARLNLGHPSMSEVRPRRGVYLVVDESIANVFDSLSVTVEPVVPAANIAWVWQSQLGSRRQTLAEQRRTRPNLINTTYTHDIQQTFILHGRSDVAETLHISLHIIPDSQDIEDLLAARAGLQRPFPHLPTLLAVLALQSGKIVGGAAAVGSPPSRDPGVQTRSRTTVAASCFASTKMLGRAPKIEGFGRRRRRAVEWPQSSPKQAETGKHTRGHERFSALAAFLDLLSICGDPHGARCVLWALRKQVWAQRWRRRGEDNRAAVEETKDGDAAICAHERDSHCGRCAQTRPTTSSDPKQRLPNSLQAPKRLAHQRRPPPFPRAHTHVQTDAGRTPASFSTEPRRTSQHRPATQTLFPPPPRTNNRKVPECAAREL
ncbi:hypothetical protein NUW54_g387 [Trametes sanguinea]|uniref:Uncharacterized protein n=1 Tax=Trametes sanguinea TaxID=158606 RepID=A0ACC1QBT8_9APHY|nr:hypothetical protein NUW54_g387 [Trametes sanguinea]